MDDDLAFGVFVGAILVLSVIVIAIIDCVEQGQRRHEENMAIRAAAVAAGATTAAGAAAVALMILDYVSLPRQHQSARSATTAAAERPECVFCLGELEDGEDGEEWIVLKRCRHEFHRKCMAKWLEQMKSNCPTCRAAMWPDVLSETPAIADMV
jgi:hypothetical protein